jgi:hypothetical protein
MREEYLFCIKLYHNSFVVFDGIGELVCEDLKRCNFDPSYYGIDLSDQGILYTIENFGKVFCCELLVAGTNLFSGGSAEYVPLRFRAVTESEWQFLNLAPKGAQSV